MSCVLQANQQKSIATKMKDRKIKVHKLLYELFGRESTWPDILAIFAGSFSLAIMALSTIWEVDLSVIKKIVLAFLAFDIGGGVVANFTTGTNNYYGESSKKRSFFVLLHVLQPLLLIWIFPNDLYFISIISAFTLLSSLCIINITDTSFQRVSAASLLVIGILMVQLLNFSNQFVQLILLFYSIKLILAFSVNWENSHKHGNGNENST